MTKHKKQIRPKTAEEMMTFSQRAAQQIIELPRGVRILMVGLFAVAATFAVNPVIDTLYIQFFYNADTVILPSIAAVFVGMVVYVLGWLLMIGTVGETPPIRRVIVWYCLVGLLVVVLVVGALIMGLNSGNAPGY
ncbi:MAG: hypothetical protein H6671_03170 [Anaerolineaceae bacterium]|nr:hypothetical protein [Anaerolineaceae bacterium]